MKVLVTGKSGQVARCLADKAADFPELELTFAARPDFDLIDPASIEACLDEIRPDLVINAAAYTAVDKAEDEPELALAINGIAPGLLASKARELGAGVLQVSTDYVFDGTSERAYRESDPVAPLGIYGGTKLAGEESARGANPDHLILRTAWVFSPYGNNFVKTMLRLAKDREQLSVVDDQKGNPTSAHDIAVALLTIAETWRQGNKVGQGEIYHFGGGVETSWCGFAREIFRLSAELGGPYAEVTAIPSSDFPTKAERPANSRLDSDKFFRDFSTNLNRSSMIESDIIKAILSEQSV